MAFAPALWASAALDVFQEQKALFPGASWSCSGCNSGPAWILGGGPPGVAAGVLGLGGVEKVWLAWGSQIQMS
jgi:hypothetical protein